MTAKPPLPRADVINPLPLPAPFDIPVPPGLLRELNTLAPYLKYERTYAFTRTSVEEWDAENHRLALEVQAGGLLSDASFIKLVERDKRYMGTKFGQAKLLEWFLFALYGQENPTPPGLKERLDKAPENLREVARAVGLRGFIGGAKRTRHAVVLANYLDVQNRIARAVALMERLKSTSLFARIASRTRLDEDVVEYLGRCWPRGRKRAAEVQCARRFSLSNSLDVNGSRQMRQLIAQAQDSGIG